MVMYTHTHTHKKRKTCLYYADNYIVSNFDPLLQIQITMVNFKYDLSHLAVLL